MGEADWLSRIQAHPHALRVALFSSCVSLVVMIGGLLVMRWLLVWLPADHFVRRHDHSRFVRILRGGLALVLVAAGLAMMVLPGPGILTFLVGISLVDLPIRHRVVIALLRRKHVHHAIDRLRLRAGKAPFVLPEHSPSHA